MIIGIIDDDDAKRAALRAEIETAAGDRPQIYEGSSLAEARKLMRDCQLDLLVLDIALPDLKDGDPSPCGGMDLIDEVLQSNRYMLPAHVIGVTALEEIYGAAVERFGRELWSVLRYDRSSTQWAELLSAKVRHLLRSRKVGQQNFDYDLAIVAALKEPELSSVLDLPWQWATEDKPGDATQYHIGEFKRLDGTTGKVVAARAPRMGMPATATLATKMGLQFRPRFMAMIGICAGRKGDTNLGDIVVANPSWDYGSGKHSKIDNKDVFEPAPHPFPLTTRVRGLIERYEGESERMMIQRVGFRGNKPDTTPKLHIGPFASGAAVVARAEMMGEIKSQNRKLLAVDMEAYGIASAATELPQPQPDFLMLKGVSDFADEEKSDAYREYAAYMSAQFLAHLCIADNLC
ncbi:MAG: hypothetical protein PBV01_24260 [Brucella anthropi]